VIAKDPPTPRRSGNGLDDEVLGNSAGTMNACDAHLAASVGSNMRGARQQNTGSAPAAPWISLRLHDFMSSNETQDQFAVFSVPVVLFKSA
jgi:hypothetical protein